MATLPKILKTYKVDKILGYRQLPPEKDGKVLVGWEERNELPAGKELVICRPVKKSKGEITVATKEDYISFFFVAAGTSPADFVSKIQDLNSEIKDLKLQVDFAKSMAKLLLNGTSFSWDTKEFLVIEEKLS